MTTGIERLTPMMEQWHGCKQAAKEAILLFRMGDFYEAFYEDAEILAEALDLTLTKRQGIPMAGVPWHTYENYVDRLVAQGYKVAIAEQIENSSQAKGLVERKIVRFVTPGTVINPMEATNNFIIALEKVGAIYGLAFLDLTTAQFQVAEFEDIKDLLSEIYRLSPKEVVTTQKFKKAHEAFFNEIGKMVVSTAPAWQFDHKTASRYLTDHFQVSHLDGFGLKAMVAAINAAGGLLSYIHEDLCFPISHIRDIKPLSLKKTLAIDRVSQRNLELTESTYNSQRSASLMAVLDHTNTPMGKRLLREWIKRPLVDVKAIHERLDAIETLYHAPQLLAQLRGHLRPIRDIERLMTRIVSGYATPRDLLALATSLSQLPLIKETLEQLGLMCSLPDLREICVKITQALVPEPPIRITEGGIFQEGFNEKLDELRELTKGGKKWLASYQTKIKEQTGIKTLKVSYNKVFGYYIEVSKGQAHLMPDSFQRRQTLVNSERFISPILKEYESKVLSAEEQIHTLEQTLFQTLREESAHYEKVVFQMARDLARFDVLASLAMVAKKENYCRPVVDTSDTLMLIEGRHPVVEVASKEKFIPNDTQLQHKERLILITGPNMAGKSTYIRQVALIVIMAQMGSFVPCTKAHIGVVDKIFTRIGANDDLSRGQSTFMVEMSETANILNNATAKSLVILDEIGRGTSTYDGVAIAWAVAEDLLKKQTKTLFATHYWELTDLEQNFEGAVNYHATVLEQSDEIVLMHKIAPGSANRSYGVHVARLAGLPLPVIARATTILHKLETRKTNTKKKIPNKSSEQLTLF